MASFQQGELIKVLLAHEASNLSGSMLEQLSARKLGTKELEEQITEELESTTMSLKKGTTSLKSRTQSLKTKETKRRPQSLQRRNKSLKRRTQTLKIGSKSLKSSKQTLKIRTKSLQSTAKSLKSKANQLEEKNKELQEQPADLDIALIKTVLLQLPEEIELDFNMMIGEEACKSFRQMASTQLPQQEVKGAWLEQLDFRAAAYHW